MPDGASRFGRIAYRRRRFSQAPQGDLISCGSQPLNHIEPTLQEPVARARDEGGLTVTTPEQASSGRAEGRLAGGRSLGGTRLFPTSVAGFEKRSGVIWTLTTVNRFYFETLVPHDLMRGRASWRGSNGCNHPNIGGSGRRSFGPRRKTWSIRRREKASGELRSIMTT